MSLVLVSHALCPYVQRAAIVLMEKGIAFERRDVDLGDKPAWFLEVSPLGKTPVLLVDGVAVFESAVICEYLDETAAPRLHPADALQRARHRAWMAFGSTVLEQIAGFYSAPDRAALDARAAQIHFSFRQIEPELGEGPFFAGPAFGMVDAAFGPVFRYFDLFDELGDLGFWSGVPRVAAWRAAVQARATVRAAVSPTYAGDLRRFIVRRSSHASRLLEGTGG